MMSSISFPSLEASVGSINFAAAGQKVYLVPRWSGDPASDWYPACFEAFAHERQEATQEKAGLCVLSMPHWDAPTVEDSVAALCEVLPPTSLTSDVLLVGHSVGCQAWLHYLAHVAQQAPDARCGGLLCVAGWFDVDEHWDTIVPWVEASVDHAAIRSICPNVRVLLSDNDPFTSDFQTNQQQWEQRLQADVTVHEDAKHFNHPAEEVPIQTIFSMLQRMGSKTALTLTRER